MCPDFSWWLFFGWHKKTIYLWRNKARQDRINYEVVNKRFFQLTATSQNISAKLAEQAKYHSNDGVLQDNLMFLADLPTRHGGQLLFDSPVGQTLKNLNCHRQYHPIVTNKSRSLIAGRLFDEWPDYEQSSWLVTSIQQAFEDKEGCHILCQVAQGIIWL